MDAVISQVQVNARRVLILQLVIAAIAAAVLVATSGMMHGVAAFFGGLISVSASLLLRRGVMKAGQVAAEDPSRGMVMLYMGAVQRFVLILAMFGLGLGVFKLEPLATVIGFGATQLAYVVLMKLSAKPGRR